MPWRSFVLWNALGGIVWATAIGLIAYFLGQSAGGAIEAFGLFGLVPCCLRSSRVPVPPPPAQARGRDGERRRGASPDRPARETQDAGDVDVQPG